MALAFSSSAVIHGSLSSSSSYEQQQPKVSHMGITQPMDRSRIPLKAVNFTQRSLAMKPLVPLAATIVAPEVEQKAEADDYEKLAKELTNASPLKIMDKALEKFGSEIAIAFRYTFFFFGLGGVSLSRTLLTRDALCTGLPIGVEFSYPN